MENFKKEKRFISSINGKVARSCYKLFLAALSFVLVFFGTAKTVNAANLYLSPSAGSYEVNKAFSVSVFVSSSDQAINAAGGAIFFPSDKLEITSLSKSGSILSLWVQEPSFSNSAGTINFEGVVMNPGFTGAGGKIITINFKTKNNGQATLSFSSGTILANDGIGTNILDGLGSAQFNIAAPVSEKASSAADMPAEEKSVPLEKTSSPAKEKSTPAAPKVSSPTHPNQEKWYNNKNPQFLWILPAGVNGISVYFSQSSTSSPGPVSDGIFTDKSYENVEDGAWYFYIKFRNSYGWGPVTHFKIQIDTQPPKQFNVSFPHGAKSDDPRPIALFNTIDSLSGISHYEAKIGEADLLKIDPREIESNPYSVPSQPLGKRTIIVKAFDLAGNEATAVGEFEIEPIDAPKITSCPKTLAAGEILIMEGETYPGATVAVSVKDESSSVNTHETKSNSLGYFRVIWPTFFSEGTYTLSARVTDNRGATSHDSAPLTFSVEAPKFLTIGGRAITVLAVVTPLVALIFTLLFIICYGWHKFSILRSRFRKEVREAERALYRVFDLLRKDIQEQIKFLEKEKNKRKLTKEEKKNIKRLEKDLDDVEKFIRKEVESIKEVENIKIKKEVKL